ncbi:hypothetical protein ACR79B_20730 [Sphingobacterium spiritivorum]|uniref:hypothetical protein n=1 Tax=Sphingobacterium spiritivorum TaxID=258 RepID=UPI003DA3A507
MNKTQIQFKGEEIDILFGCWSVGQLIKSGIDLDNLVGGDIFDKLPDIVYYGACNAKGRDLNAYSLNDFHELAPGVLLKVLPVLTNSMQQDVPKKKEVKPAVRKGR